MKSSDPRVVLWANVEALMKHHWGKENLTRLAREARVGPGTATRMKERSTSIGIDVLERVAGVFGLQSWQLLVPNLRPSDPPLLELSREERELYRRMMVTAQEITKYGL